MKKGPIHRKPYFEGTYDRRTDPFQVYMGESTRKAMEDAMLQWLHERELVAWFGTRPFKKRSIIISKAIRIL